ncbi:thioredoxin peroxidase TSA1 [Sugiyamaella lignohabitans]|uniref:thioredoxin-dependent peroxiredoxin n=1 Tax=Sugiyamaella lignohabitans TaxID=796027 RepID=A0A167E6Z8_9ASCO|nr:thioredoxin peroxidase TSA1 [Sugiyamaella lignohabitans]ANB13721.1 thioredoxin peroxidase TSA1 [Sugiyamaella lignohabitans]
MVATVRHPAPAFTKKAVVNGVFEDVSLEQYKGKWVILAFIPLAFTFVCPTEIIAYSDAVKEFADRDAVVLFASTDSEFSLLAWDNVSKKDGGLGNVKIPLVADTNHSLSRDYGVLVEEEGIALRGIFLIDPNQVVRQITINDTPVGRSVPETLRLLDAFQFTEKHGEVCPANWQKGDATIDTSKASEYFQKQA